MRDGTVRYHQQVPPERCWYSFDGSPDTHSESMPETPQRPAYFSTAFKITAGAISGLAALVSVLTFARQEGMIGPIATLRAKVARIHLTPSADTAWALGDTLTFAALATDTNGVVLNDPALVWSVTNTEVAEAHPDGSVIATGAGETALVVTAGNTIAQARIVVHPRTVMLKPSEDTVYLPEGASTSLIAVPYDARGRAIRGMLARWRSFDTTVVVVDSFGLAMAGHPGLAQAEARLDGASARLVVRVTPVLGALVVGPGGGQHALAGTPLPLAVVVRTLSRQQQAIGGILVRGSVDGGRLHSDTARSGADGAARFRWTLGERPGTQHLTASVDEIDSALTVTAEADPVDGNTNFVLVDSLGSAGAGSALASRVVVRVTDTLGQVLSGVPARWFGFDGSRIVATAERTDSLGLATAAWTLGPKVGVNRARLIAGPRNTPYFPLTIRSLAGPPSNIAVLTGDKQRIAVGRNVTVRVRVTDAQGNVVGGVGLQSVLAAGSAALLDQVTGQEGTARLRWTLGPTAGEQALELHAGSAKVRLTATALPAPASQVEIVAPTITIVASKSVRVVAVVSDSLGNPITGTMVQPRVTDGGVTPLRATTNAQGRATFTWTLARRAGDQTIRVHATGVRTDATKTVRRPTTR